MPAADKHSRTEPPTPKRRNEARKEGRVARSPDVAGWAAVMVATYVLPWYFNGARGRVLGLVAQAAHVGTIPSVPGALGVLEAGLRVVLVTALPLGGIFALLAIVANIAQTGRNFSFKAARPKLSRLSPKTGFKRLFSPTTGTQLLKQVVKLLLLTAVGYQLLASLFHQMIGKQPVSLLPVLAVTASDVLGSVRLISLLGFLVGVGDFAFQRHKLNQSLKMTKDEVKDEARAAEGDPFMKGELKKRMYMIARSQLIRAVRSADVVVTNPTHYAVALQYDRQRAGAPRVVAKGADLLAARIREEAATFAVPVVEDPPLARYLYAICELDAQIPSEIFLAVARLLAFVYALPEVVRGVGVHHPVPSSVPAAPEVLATLGEDQRRRLAEVLAGSTR